jgi:hypothetical protein
MAGIAAVRRSISARSRALNSASPKEARFAESRTSDTVRAPWVTSGLIASGVLIVPDDRGVSETFLVRQFKAADVLKALSSNRGMDEINEVAWGFAPPIGSGN